MKTSQDPRHLKRIHLVKDLFAWEFYPKNNPLNPSYLDLFNHLKEVDPVIEGSAKEWPIAQISKIDLAILRVAVYELMVSYDLFKLPVETNQSHAIIEKKTPYKVIVDEGIEIAKEYGSESSPSFINGVLGNIISKYNLDQEKV